MRYKKFISFFSVFIFSIIFSTKNVFAEITRNYRGGNTDIYKGYTDKDSGFIGFFANDHIAEMMNDFANSLFNINKFIYKGVDSALDVLLGGNSLVDIQNKIENLANLIWKNLYSGFGAILLICLAVWAFIAYYGFRKTNAVQIVFKSIAILMLSMVWFAHSGELIGDLNSVTNEVQKSVSQSTTSVGGHDGKTSKQVMRDNWFDVSVLRPYYLMNYGETSEDSVNKAYGKNAARNLLDKATDDKDKQDDLTKVLQDQTKAGDKYLSLSQAGYKFSIVLISFFVEIPLALIFFMLALLTVFLDLLILFMQILIPIMAIISLVPRFGDSFMNGIRGIVSISFGKIFISVLLLMVELTISIVDTIVKPTNIGTYLVNSVLLISLLFLMWKSRNLIASKLNMGSNPVVNMANKVDEKANRAKAMVVGGAAAALHTPDVPDDPPVPPREKDPEKDPNNKEDPNTNNNANNGPVDRTPQNEDGDNSDENVEDTGTVTYDDTDVENLNSEDDLGDTSVAQNDDISNGTDVYINDDTPDSEIEDQFKDMEDLDIKRNVNLTNDVDVDNDYDEKNNSDITNEINELDKINHDKSNLNASNQDLPDNVYNFTEHSNTDPDFESNLAELRGDK